MPKTSAGLLMFSKDPQLKVLLVHPGGLFFAKKDVGVMFEIKGVKEKINHAQIKLLDKLISLIYES